MEIHHIPGTEIFIPPWAKIGVPPYEFWNNFAEIINEFQKAGSFRLVTQEERDLPSKQAEFIGETHGGRRGPHLHYQGKTYLVDAKQWKEFSDKVVKEFQKKLEHANAIPIQQLQELDSIISGLSMKA